ncbi:hypothetical protein GCM10008905_10690 [Clostridium malenominatum]|uniref:DUF3784 domain-containing protein n=1 Tax=Clostridium malenominatum TaxID=1539 RepID=A0ABP3U2H1_9CLOT
MDKFQRGIVVITFASLAIYIVLSIVNVEKSSKWIKWYWQMDVDEQRKYDPRIAICRLKKMLVIMLAVGMCGFLFSWFIKPVISIITLGVIMVILVFSISYIGPKNCLLSEKNKIIITKFHI